MLFDRNPLRHSLITKLENQVNCTNVMEGK